MAFASPRNLTSLTSSTSEWLQKKTHLSNVCSSNIFIDFSNNRSPCARSRRSKQVSICCSTQPNIDKENVKDGSFNTGSTSSGSRIQEHMTSGSNPALSSSSSSGSRGLIFDLGFKDSWDSAEVGSPVVKRFLGDEEERWYMWYHGRSRGKDSIGLAVSRNGIHWERGERVVESSADVGLSMNCSTDWWTFDTQAIRPSEVVVMSSAKVKVNNALYWLYYTGFSQEKVDLQDCDIENLVGARTGIDFDGVCKSLPGLAMSQDGRHWARIEGEHHSGALFDVGSMGEWDSLFIASPQVVFHGRGDLRMYYHSFDLEKRQFAVGLARSRDGIQWVKLGKILGGGAKGTFDELGAMNPHVVKDQKDGKYVMVYEGLAANGCQSIGLAFSSDGLQQWRRYEECSLLKQSEDGWDCGGVGSPYLVQMDETVDEWRLYYGGIGKGGKTGIGLAVSQGSVFPDFKRWTAFHL